MDVFVARQPIFDQDKQLFAYELLFRSGISNVFPEIDGVTATSNLLSSSFFTVGIERISAGKKVFINFTEELLLRGTAEMFPAKKIIVEILENVTPSAEVIDSCRRLVDHDYTLALDDFVYYQNLEPLIELAEIIKIDFRLTSTEDIERIVYDLRSCNCRLLAEKIETYQEFEQALAMGFSYFQGYFFAKPEVLRNKDLPSSHLTVMKLICEINRVEFDIDKLDYLINQDVSLSYKLMNYLNSSHFMREKPLSSIREAIVSLGVAGVRTFISLIAAGSLAAEKPQELIKTSIIRARFLEQIGVELELKGQDFFMLGLFSLLDAMLDNSMATVLEKLPLANEVREALIHHRGQLYSYLLLVEKYESCQWSCVDSQLLTVGIPAARILDFYLDALRIADGY